MNKPDNICGVNSYGIYICRWECAPCSRVKRCPKEYNPFDVIKKEYPEKEESQDDE